MRSSRYAFTVPSLGIAGLATVLLLGAAPAFAQDSSSVEILATIDKSIIQTVDETIDIKKTVTLDAKVNVKASKFAESDTSVSQVNDFSSACENCAERTDTLSGSANYNTGIVTVNEAGGNLNNQAATISAAIDVGPGPTPDPTDNGFAESSASATQMNNDNHINVVSILFRDALITNSIHNNTGIAFVNQSVGNINNQANELSLAFSKKPEGVALSEADLGQFNAGNVDAPQSVSESSVTKTASISGGSISNNTGIVGVNQASGNFANQANIVSFAAVMP